MYDTDKSVCSCMAYHACTALYAAAFSTAPHAVSPSSTHDICGCNRAAVVAITFGGTRAMGVAMAMQEMAHSGKRPVGGKSGHSEAIATRNIPNTTYQICVRLEAAHLPMCSQWAVWCLLTGQAEAL